MKRGDPCDYKAEVARLREGFDRMNRQTAGLWEFMVRERLIDAKLAEEGGPASDHASRGRLTICEVAERVMSGLQAEAKTLRETEAAACDAYYTKDAELAACETEVARLRAFAEKVPHVPDVADCA